jgi:hypothetical protein
MVFSESAGLNATGKAALLAEGRNIAPCQPESAKVLSQPVGVVRFFLGLTGYRKQAPARFRKHIAGLLMGACYNLLQIDTSAKSISSGTVLM